MNSATPTGGDAAENEILAVARELSEAVVTNERGRIGEVLSEEWVMVSGMGVTSREEFLAVVDSGELVNTASEILGEPRVAVYGDVAVVTARTANAALQGGRRVDTDEWSTDVYTRRHGRWACVLTHVADSIPS